MLQGSNDSPLMLCHVLAGCFIAPLTFQLYWHSFKIGDPHSEYKAPFANIYRGMAVIGTQVSSTLLCT